MNAIKVVSWIHLLWGLTMLLTGEVPSLFGQLEVFLVFIDFVGWSVNVLGAVFTVSGLSAILTCRYAPRLWFVPHAIPVLLLPQQLLLTAGLMYAIELLVWYGYDVRALYAGIVQLVFCTFHMRVMYEIYRAKLLTLRSASGAMDD